MLSAIKTFNMGKITNVGTIADVISENLLLKGC